MLLKKGEYRAKAVKGVWVKSPEKGTLGVQIDWIAQVDGKAVTFRARPRWTTGNTIERVKSDLRAMGWDGKSATDLGGLGSIECQIVLAEDQRTTRDDGTGLDVDVKWVNRIGVGGELQAADPGEVEALFAVEGRRPAARSSGAEMPDESRFA
jgi:hypothetical protein